MKILILIAIAVFALFAFYGCKSVVNRLAFYPDKTDIIPGNRLPENVKEIFIETEDKLSIQAYFIPNKSSDNILLYFHGNAGNICHRLPDLLQINSFGINVLGISYRGYGKSEGKPSEEGIYMDGRAALKYATEKLGFAEENVILLGRSIGTAAAIETALNRNIKGLILVTPLTSGKDEARAAGVGSLSSLAGASFNNIGKIDRLSCPLLVIHGTNDDVIPFEMGKALFNRAKGEKKFVKIEGADHNNISSEYGAKYWPPIDEFIRGL
ncbi:MAG: alpha/beta hydrolase [Deltaproteobacteria bacterium]|nr:alpha/beta hydrolase [Deltaproteobacteria bacterium]